MAREVRQYAVTITAGTTQAAPSLTTLTMPARIVRKVRVRVPKGPSGLMGFALASGGVPVIPWGSGQWFVTDDEEIILELDGQITSGAWQLRGYNTGVYDHTVQLTFYLDPPQVAVVPGGAGGSPFIGSGDIGGGFLVPPPGPGDQAPPPGDGGGTAEPPPGDGGGTEPPPGDGGGTAPPPIAPDGYAAAKVNALYALQVALGDLPSVAPLPVPPAGSLDRTAYDAAKAAIVASIQALYSI